MKLKNINTGLVFLMEGKRAISLASSSNYEIIESSENEKQLYKKEEIKNISLEDKLLGNEVKPKKKKSPKITNER